MGKIIIRDIGDLRDCAEAFLRQTAGTAVYAFYAPMGAGKTTFISALCEVLGVRDEVSSPTFTIVNEYGTRQGGRVYHFDFYRINKISEVLDIGYEEYIGDDAVSFMEWPEMIEDILPEDALKVHISVADDGARIVTF